MIWITKIFQIRLATANTSFGILELGHFQLNTVGTLTKIIYAFLWQVQSIYQG